LNSRLKKTKGVKVEVWVFAMKALTRFKHLISSGNIVTELTKQELYLTI